MECDQFEEALSLMWFALDDVRPGKGPLFLPTLLFNEKKLFLKIIVQNQVLPWGHLQTKYLPWGHNGRNTW